VINAPTIWLQNLLYQPASFFYQLLALSFLSL
jgi:hypothetical protein